MAWVVIRTRLCLIHTCTPHRHARACTPHVHMLPRGAGGSAVPAPPGFLGLSLPCPGPLRPALARLVPCPHTATKACGPVPPAQAPPAPSLLASSARPVFPAAATPSPGLPGRQVSPRTRPSHSGTPQPPAGTPGLPGSGPATRHLARGPPEALWGARPSRSPHTAAWRRPPLQPPLRPPRASPRCGLSPAGEPSQQDRARVLQHFPKAAEGRVGLGCGEVGEPAAA